MTKPTKTLCPKTLATVGRRLLRRARSMETHPAYDSDLIGQREHLRGWASALDSTGRELLADSRATKRKAKR